jgi:hypothetical protein
MLKKSRLSYRGRPFSGSLTAIVYFFAAAIIFCIPPLYHERAAAVFPDEQTLIAAYATADSCDIRTAPLADRGSYACSALVLRGMGINAVTGPWLGAVVSVALTLLPLMRTVRVPLHVFLVACAWGVVRAAFLSVLSKDLLSALVVLPLTVIAGRRSFGMTWFGGGLIYGWVVRKYWILAGLIWLALSALQKWLTPLRFIAGLIAMYVLMALAFQFLLGQQLDFARVSMNENRVVGAEGAQTVIVPILSSPNPLAQAGNAFLVLVRLIFPFELLRMLSPEKIIFVLITPISIWWAVEISILSVKTTSHRLIAAGKVALAPLAFLVVESLFEPDFGSFARHFSMVSPLIFSAMAVARTKGGTLYDGKESRFA